MRHSKKESSVTFGSIGLSDNLQPISCIADRPAPHFYPSAENHILKVHEDNTVQTGENASHQERRQNSTKYDRSSKQGRRSEERLLGAGSSCLKKGPTSYWPSELTHDLTGATMSKLRSYVQSHKVNTFIKYSLMDGQGDHRPNRNQREYNQSRVNHEAGPSYQRNSSAHRDNRRDFIKVDYQVVKIQRDTPRRAHQQPQCQAQPRRSATLDPKFGNAGPRTWQQYNHSLRIKAENKSEPRVLDVREREYLVPNRSVHLAKSCIQLKTKSREVYISHATTQSRDRKAGYRHQNIEEQSAQYRSKKAGYCERVPRSRSEREVLLRQ